MRAEDVSRAIRAVAALAGESQLAMDDTVVLHNSNKLALRLLPCDVFARVAASGHEVFAREVTLALALEGSPVAALDPRFDPRPYERDGFVVTWWTYHESSGVGQIPPAAYADALHRLHTRMRTLEVDVPHALERVAAAERLLTHRAETPALAEADRELLLDTVRGVRDRIRSRGAAEQVLHGEPHPGNLLNTRGGLRFIDWETACRGPVEFDVAHVPEDVAIRYPDLDPGLLADCRRLVLALVATWRWDVRDEFPDGQQQGRDLVDQLRRLGTS